MTVSVALCTYNGEKYLREQLESILSQSLLPDEIIVCDDKSTDNTLAILQEYQTRFQKPVIEIFSNDERLNVVKNFEKAITKCNCDFIFLCDQDDLWTPNKIADTLSFFNTNPKTDVVFTNAYYIGIKHGKIWDSFVNKKIKKTWLKHGSLYAFMRYKYVCTGACMAIRANARPYLLPIQQNSFQIHDGWIGIAAATKNSIAYLDKCLIKYRIHSSQWSTANDFKTNLSLKRDIDKKCEYIKYFIDYYNINNTIVLEMYDHYLKRQQLPKNFLNRLRVVISQLINRNYFRHSNGFISVIKDLFFEPFVKKNMQAPKP